MVWGLELGLKCMVWGLGPGSKMYGFGVGAGSNLLQSHETTSKAQTISLIFALEPHETTL